MLRAHGMVREAEQDITKQRYIEENPDLNEKFIFAFPSYNMRNNEIGGILGRSQLKRLDANNKIRTDNQAFFLSLINPEIYHTDFETKGSSNYAFNLVLREKDDVLMERLMHHLEVNGIEYRRGSAGGGNQLRQPYLKPVVGNEAWKEYPITDHIHFYGMYIGNFPSLSMDEIIEITSIINSAV